MSQEINDNFEPRVPKPIDNRLGVWKNGAYRLFNSKAEACAHILQDYRYENLIVYIKEGSSVKKYRWLDDLTDNGLTFFVDEISNIDAEDGIELIDNSGNILLKTRFSSDLEDSLSTIQVGGLQPTTLGNLKSKSLNKIVEEIVAPTINPTLIAPSHTFTSFPVNNSELEVGSQLDITFTSNFDRGSISPQFTSASNFRSGNPVKYNYFGVGLSHSVNSFLVDQQTLNNYTLLQGNNIWENSVEYLGGVQPKNNKGENFSNPLPSGVTNKKSVNIIGIYPYFWLKSDNLLTPDIVKSRIENEIANKVVANSNGDITINFNANQQYLAFAIPFNYPIKTKWQGTNSISNTGIIGGINGVNLFSNPEIRTINSQLWSGVQYRIYICEYKTSTLGFSIIIKN